MSKPDLSPLEADVLEIVHKERAIDEPVSDVKARMLAAVSARLGVPPPDGGGVGGGGGAGPPVRGAGQTARFSLSGWRAALVVAASFGLGVAVRSAFMPEPRVIVAERVPVMSAPAPLPPVPVEEPAVVEAPVSPAPRATASAEPDNRSLAGERALLDVARTALANGDSAKALSAVLRHERTYPNGLLVEEREAIAVKALVAAGRADEARARGARYVKRFPSGLMRPAVEAALQSLPAAP
jgi:hypothetical protein